MHFVRAAHREGTPTVPLKDNMTGTAYFDAILFADGCAGGNVTFAPGARTYWHTHEKGQFLHVSQGAGLIQSEGEAPVKLQVGDVIYIPGGEKHWHGAAHDTIMTHMAIAFGGCEWHEEVDQEQYERASKQSI